MKNDLADQGRCDEWLWEILPFLTQFSFCAVTKHNSVKVQAPIHTCEGGTGQNSLL